MSKYIDLVLCHSEGTKVLAEAPSFSHLGEGDLIKLAGFSGYFEKEEWERISSMLGKGYLVPQEILTAKDFAK